MKIVLVVPLLVLDLVVLPFSEAVVKPVLVIGGQWARWVMKEFPDEKFDPKLVKMGPEKVDSKGPGKLEPGGKNNKIPPGGRKEFPPDSFPDN